MRYFLCALIPVVVCAAIVVSRLILKEKERERERLDRDTQVFRLSPAMLSIVFPISPVLLSVLVAVYDMFFDSLAVRNDWQILAVINCFFAVALCAGIFLSIQVYRQSITVVRNTVIYVPLIGTKKTFDIRDIEKIIVQDGIYKAYSHQKILFQYSRVIPKVTELTALLKAHDIPFVDLNGKSVE